MLKDRGFAVAGIHPGFGARWLGWRARRLLCWAAEAQTGEFRDVGLALRHDWGVVKARNRTLRYENTVTTVIP